MKTNLIAVMVLCAFSLGARTEEPVPTWDKQKAAKRLDERTKSWIQAGKKLSTDSADKVTCLSCHTTVPYALARPVLAKKLGERELPALDSLLKNVDRRLIAWPTVTHMYDFDQEKIKESKGTEAILSSMMLAWNDAVRGETSPSAATQRAFERLWETQRADGGWDWLRFTLEPWETLDAEYFGSALAALAVGTAPGYYANADENLKTKVNALRTYLTNKRNKKDLHAETWLLLASTKLKGLLDDTQRQQLIDALKKEQKKEGADAGGWVLLEFSKWRYLSKPPEPMSSEQTARELAVEAHHPDGYATGLVIFTLLEAGVPVNDPKVQAGLKWLRANQQSDGSWPGASINEKRPPENFAVLFMSDAGTAWAALALLKAETLAAQ